MYSWIWVQSILPKWWLPGYTVLIPQRWKLDLAWHGHLGVCATIRVLAGLPSTRKLAISWFGSELATSM